MIHLEKKEKIFAPIMVKFPLLQALISKNLTAAICASVLTPQQPKAQ